MVARGSRVGACTPTLRILGSCAQGRQGQPYKDPLNLQTTYVRNGFGEVIRQTSPDTGITDYVREARGLITQMTDARGIVTQYAYDDAGRRTAKTFPTAPGENVT